MQLFTDLVKLNGHCHDQSIGDLVFTVTNGNYTSWVGVLLQNEQLVVTTYSPSLAGEQPSVSAQIISGEQAIQAAFEQFVQGTDLNELAWL